MFTVICVSLGNPCPGPNTIAIVVSTTIRAMRVFFFANTNDAVENICIARSYQKGFCISHGCKTLDHCMPAR